MIINLPITFNAEQEIKYSVALNGDITSNSNYFNVPIKIKGTNFSPTDKFDLKITDASGNQLNISTLDITYLNNDYITTTLVIPTTSSGSSLNLLMSLSINNNKPSSSFSFQLSLPTLTKKTSLSTPAIVGISVTVIVVVGLIGWIIYLVQKRSKQKALDRYHNKRKKY